MLNFDMNEYCYGCGTCKYVCPKQAIKMINNEDGFIIPKIDESRCIKCGLCEKKCIYLNKVISNSKTDITASSCYMMYFLNDKILESASGGIFYGIAVKAIELGYEVCGCIYQLYKSGTSTADIRGVYLTTNTINSGSLWSLFDGPIFGALRIAVTNIVVIQWFSGKSKDWKLLLINLLSLLIRSFVGSDRLFLFDFVFVFVFGFLLNHKRRRSFEQTKKEMRKKRIFLFVFVGLVIAVILYFTNQRQANSELIDVIYSEFTCGFQIFDIIVDKIDASGIMTFGISTFTGFIVLINLILAYLGFGQIPFVNEINKYDVPFWNIGGGHMNNGYLPYFVPFYLDLREFGIFIGSIFLGFLMARIYKKLKVNNSSYYQSLYLMLILLLVRLTLRFYFTRSDYIMAIVYTIFLYTWKFKIKSKREDVLKNE